MTYQSEHELEELLIKQLATQGYDRVSIKDEDSLKAILEISFLNLIKKN